MLKKYVGTGNGPVKLFKGEMDCCAGGTPCKYTASTQQNITGFIYVDKDGNDQTYTFPGGAVTVSDEAAIKAAFVAGLKVVGFSDDTSVKDGYNYIEAINVSYSSPAVSITIYSELVLKTVVDAGSNQNFTQECTKSKVCKTSFDVVYDVDPGKIAYNGSAGTAVGSTPWFAAGDAAAVTTAVKAALTTESIQFYDVQTDEVGGKYVTYIWVYGECNLLTLNGVAGPNGGTFIDFQ